jgi:hypothetical protein
MVINVMFGVIIIWLFRKDRFSLRLFLDALDVLFLTGNEISAYQEKGNENAEIYPDLIHRFRFYSYNEDSEKDIVFPI